MADASSSSSSSQHKYDVFLSFRGEDTRNNFTAHLYHALCQKGIYTFIDDDKLERGEVISSALVEAIENSMFSIIVLSENYASSRWCLEELVKILECKENKGQTVLPIFYHVDPSDVRKQRGKFGEALAKHKKNMKENMERVKIWRDALTQVANLSGWDTKNIKNELLLIKEVAENIWNKLLSTLTSDTEDLVGIDSHIQEVETLLCLEADDVRMVGIWGMGGIGKTTLARAIYQKISDKFEDRCFLDDVADLARKGQDLKKLLLSNVLRDKNIDVTAPSLKARLHFKKVLIVIDNVNNREILENLVGGPNCFGPKSRIIITTRDTHLLAAYGVNDVYEVQKLQDEKATKLFNHYAFRNDTPSRDVIELIDHVIAYAQGLPLALKVLGSSLCKKSKDEWLCELNKLQKIPNMEIQNVLQTSFDELDYYQQNLFLDIAFVFWGELKDFVIDILNSCGFFPISGIRTLIDKSLISYIDDQLHIHDLLIEMGKEIVRRTFPKEPGKRSRLWMQQDICHVLENLTGTEKVEVIDLDLHGLKEIRFTTAAFAKMTKLRVLQIDGAQMQCEVHISDDFKFHYDELRYLFWDYYPLKLLPSDFKSKNLVWLRMPNSHLTQLWEGNKVFENLKHMDLSDSKYLTETPDFSRVTNLECLILDGCTQLCKIHPSLGNLDKLTLLSLENCINLKHFPGIYQLVSLKTLILSGCPKLEKFPDIAQHMPCLSKLYLDGTAITELPSSIAYATELVLLDLKNCRKLWSLPSSICQLTLLETLSLSGCSVLGKCEVNSGNLDALPMTLDKLCNLWRLELQNCRSLRALPALPSSLDIINARNCESLEDAGAFSQLVSVKTLILSGCPKLEKFPDIAQHMPCLSKLYLDGTAITEIPPSIFYATELVLLDLKNCRKLCSLPSSICQLKLLETLYLSGCLDLGKCEVNSGNLDALPRSLDQCCKPWRLELQNCTSLRALPMLPSNLEFINASNCESLEDISPQSVFSQLKRSMFGNCFKLTKFQSRMERDLQSMAANVDQEKWRSTFEEQNPGVDVLFSTVFPGSGIPDWFEHRSEGHEINIEVSQNWYASDFLGFALSAVVAPEKDPLTSGWITYCDLRCGAFNSELKSNGIFSFSFVDDWTEQLEHITIASDHMWLAYVPSFLGFSPEKWSCIKFSFRTDKESCIVKRCGVCPVYIRSSSLDDAESTNAHAHDQEWFERQPSPSISNIKIRSLVFITILSFLLLVRIFYWAPFQIPPLVDALFWISPLVAAPFGTSTLVAAPFGISTLLGAPFGISTLLGGVVLLLFISSRLYSL